MIGAFDRMLHIYRRLSQKDKLLLWSIPVLVLIVIAGSLGALDAQAFNDVFQGLAGLFTVIAIVVGGIWAYFRFVKGRTYISNLEMRVGGEGIPKDESIHLLVSASVKNIGLSEFSINHEWSGLHVSAFRVGTQLTVPTRARWEHLAAWSFFEEVHTLEPGESASEQNLFLIPDSNYYALKIELQIASADDEGWTSAAIVNIHSKEDNSSRNNEGQG